MIIRIGGGPNILTVVRFQRYQTHWLLAPHTNAGIVYHQDLDVSSVCYESGTDKFFELSRQFVVYE